MRALNILEHGLTIYSDYYSGNPIALRMTKTVCSFGCY